MNFLNLHNRLIRDLFLLEVRHTKVKTWAESIHNFGDTLIRIGLLRDLNYPRWVWRVEIKGSKEDSVQKGSWLSSIFHIAVRASVVSLAVLKCLPHCSLDFVLSGKLLSANNFTIAQYILVAGVASQVSFVAVGVLLKSTAYICSSEVRENYRIADQFIRQGILLEDKFKTPPGTPTTKTRKDKDLEQLRLDLESDTQVDVQKYLNRVAGSDEVDAKKAWEDLNANGGKSFKAQVVLNFQSWIEEGKWTLVNLRNYLMHYPGKDFADKGLINLVVYYLEKRSLDNALIEKLGNPCLFPLGGESLENAEMRQRQFYDALIENKLLDAFYGKANGPQRVQLNVLASKKKMWDAVSSSPIYKGSSIERREEYLAQAIVDIFLGDDTDALTRAQIKTRENPNIRNVVVTSAQCALARDTLMPWNGDQVKKFISNCSVEVFVDLCQSLDVWLNPNSRTVILDRFVEIYKTGLFDETIQDVIAFNIDTQELEDPTEAESRMKFFWQQMGAQGIAKTIYDSVDVASQQKIGRILPSIICQDQ